MTTTTHVDGLVAPGFEEVLRDAVYRAMGRLTRWRSAVETPVP